MTRHLTYAALTVCIVTGSLVVAAQQPVFRGRRDAVRVFATVTDGDGRLVTTLTQDDFEVRDERQAPADHALRQHARNPSVSSSCSTSRAAWRATCRCCARRPNSSSRGCGPTIARASARSGSDVTISASFTRDAEALRAALPDRDRARCADAALARDRPGAGRVRGEEDERPVILVLSDGKDSGPTSFRQRTSARPRSSIARGART